MTSGAGRALLPWLANQLAGTFGTDTRPQEPAGIEALASHFAGNLCNSREDLVALRRDVQWLLDEEPEARLALDHACDQVWDDDPAERVAMRFVLSEYLRALDSRIAWEARRVDDPPGSD